MLKKQKNSGEINIAITHAQAKRVAWRIVKRWIDAQVAFVESGMLKFDEVFLSYKLDNYNSMPRGSEGRLPTLAQRPDNVIEKASRSVVEREAEKYR
ncbi:MAG: hypothetical protein P4L49_03355 [Desulfosporosinus sp.]|nr:hypothetical protein [Desulfosporosinus sp.]